MTWQDEYEPVEDRLRQFWEDHPYGRVITELLHADHDAQDYIVQASVYFGNELRNDPPTATGLAHDAAAMLGPTLRNSALEVCETSAIGRALANANYAAKGKRPSREEMAKTAGVSATGAALPAGAPADTSVGGDGYGEGPQPPADDPLQELVATYGTASAALVAARRLWDVTSVSQLQPAQITELMRVKR